MFINVVRLSFKSFTNKCLNSCDGNMKGGNGLFNGRSLLFFNFHIVLILYGHFFQVPSVEVNALMKTFKMKPLLFPVCSYSPFHGYIFASILSP